MRRAEMFSGIRDITPVSVLHWSKSRNYTNPRRPLDAILNYKNSYTENHRFPTLGTLK